MIKMRLLPEGTKIIVKYKNNASPNGVDYKELTNSLVACGSFIDHFLDWLTNLYQCELDFVKLAVFEEKEIKYIAEWEIGGFKFYE